MLRTDWVENQSGHVAEHNEIGTLLNSTWINVKSTQYGAKGDDSTDDFAAINAAITDCPAGGTVFFPPGKYVVTNTLPIKDNITYLMFHRNRWQAYTGTTTYIKPKFGSFLGTAVFSGTEVDGAQFINMTVHSGRATGPAGAAVHGIRFTGACKGITLDNVWVNNQSGYGVYTDTTTNGFPGGWEVSNLDVENCALGGWRSENGAAKSFAFADGYMAFSEFTSNGGDGVYIAGLNAFDFNTVRSVFNVGTANGFYIDGPGGTIGFNACQTDRNIRNGILLHCVDSTPAAQPAPHGITINGGNFSRDGKNDDTTQAGYAAIRIQGDSAGTRHCPVSVNGITTHVTKNDNGTGLLSPDYAIYITNGRKVTVNGSILVATVQTIFDDNNALIHGPSNSHHLVNVSTGVVTNNIPGYGIHIAEGTNAKMGVTTLVAGTVTIANTSVTANSRIFLQRQSLGGTIGDLRVSAKTTGTSFVITSASATDTSVVDWLIIEPY